MSVSAERDPVSTVVAAAGVGLAGFLAGLVFVTFAVSLVGALVPLAEGSPERATVLMLAQYSGILAVAAFYLDASDRSLSYLRVGRPTARDLAWIVAGVLALFGTLAAATFVAEQLGLSVTDHSVSQSAADNPAMLLPLIPLSILITGPVEELLYRGVVQTRLKEAFSTAPAVGIAAVVFAAVHVPAYSLGGGSVESLATTLVVLFVLGGLLGALYEHTGNLLVPAVAHGVYNAVTFAVNYLELTGGL
ncbi:CPBP family intramembrane glutamic endopeptidase [Natronomonas marina]|jgi:membrane protease YdiL (CAAX protease family)|uniref:CPBP family intramembrane glutamic endopeptidase n=1 Tax=Natronomonas marina TaxID=2961939 RepID=UPI0020C94758|nr:CPBP family intramembrane glutamic endopeptidase [Natronomonas marina]